MNVGGDPERDDWGLPPVDIVIPDDARELDRDVQAYQRELRALRRRQRARRLRGPLTRDGMVLPLLAGCLILALITSTLLIMFAADQTGMPDPPPRPAAVHRPATVSTQPAGQVPGPLPAAILVIDGRAVAVHTITAARPTVLALIPLACRCVPALRKLRAQAAQAHVVLYLVGTVGDTKQVAGLATQAGQSPARVAEDGRNVLGRTYHQLGLTAILVRPGGSVASVSRGIPPSRGRNLGASLQLLGSAWR
ncbi:MAG TPA: hypothetical protein VH307_22395 [Streptosporangiaceae bacterium]|nr:hypothetical protein [Streptosporangiaceae bacterium]